MKCMKKGKLAEKLKEIWNTEPRSSQNDRARSQIVLHIDDE